MALIPHAIRTALCLWLAICSFGFLSDRSRTERVANRLASYVDVSRRHRRLPLSDYPRGSDWTAAYAPDWGHSDGCCRLGVRLHTQFLSANLRRHHWRHKPKWQ